MAFLSTIKSIVRHGLREERVERTVVRLPPERAGGVGGSVLVEHQCYVKISLTRMRNRDARIVHREYFPTVHSFVTLSGPGTTTEFPVVASPDKLAQLDPGDADSALPGTFVLCPATAYLGGDVGFVAGLFGVKQRDLLEDFLGVLDTMSGVVAGGEIKAALGVIEPLKGGMEKLLGLDDTRLLIGLVTTFLERNGSPPDDVDQETDTIESLLDGYYAVVNRAYEEDVRARLALHDGQLQLDGDAVSEDYFVVHVEQLPEFSDWEKLADLNQLSQDAKDAAAEHGLTSAEYKEAFVAFRSAIIHSPLIHSDQVRILKGVAKQAKELAETGPPIETLSGRQPGAALVEALADGPSIEEARTTALPPAPL